MRYIKTYESFVSDKKDEEELKKEAKISKQRKLTFFGKLRRGISRIGSTDVLNFLILLGVIFLLVMKLKWLRAEEKIRAEKERKWWEDRAKRRAEQEDKCN